jgi:hypothetical protein
LYTCIGDVILLVFESPKYQNDIPGSLLLMKETDNGSQPVNGSAIKSTTGLGLTIICILSILIQLYILNPVIVYVVVAVGETIIDC